MIDGHASVVEDRGVLSVLVLSMRLMQRVALKAVLQTQVGVFLVPMQVQMKVIW